MFWRKSHEVEIMCANNRFIDAKVKKGNVNYFMTFVYGDPERQHRSMVWNELKNIGINRSEGWDLVGDFNEIRNDDEKLGGPSKPEASFYQFCMLSRECIIKEVPNFRK